MTLILFAIATIAVFLNLNAWIEKDFDNYYTYDGKANGFWFIVWSIVWIILAYRLEVIQ